jgi:hypothetical protein
MNTQQNVVVEEPTIELVTVVVGDDSTHSCKPTCRPICSPSDPCAPCKPDK